MCGACAMRTSEVDAEGRGTGVGGDSRPAWRAPAPEPVPLGRTLTRGLPGPARAPSRGAKTARSSTREQRLEPARAIERDEVVETPDVFPVDEDLRDGAA